MAPNHGDRIIEEESDVCDISVHTRPLSQSREKQIVDFQPTRTHRRKGSVEMSQEEEDNKISIV